MDKLVDVFYYDFILSKLIEKYKKDENIKEILPFLKMATVFCKMFRDQKIVMDRQVYIKEVYLKIIQIIKHRTTYDKNTEKINNFEDGTTDENKIVDLKVVRRTLDCIKIVLEDFPDLNYDKDFHILKTIVICVYHITNKDAYINEEVWSNLKVSRENENNFDNKITGEKDQYDLYVKSLLNSLDLESKAKITSLLDAFSYSSLLDYLYSIKLDTPVMQNFVNDIKEKIDKEYKSKETIMKRDSPKRRLHGRLKVIK